MRIACPILNNVAFATVGLFFLSVATEVLAFPGGGPPPGGPPGGRMGGLHGSPPPGSRAHPRKRMRHNRIGPASGGSFTSRPRTRPNTRSVTTSRTRAPAQTHQPQPQTQVPPQAKPLASVPPEQRQLRREVQEAHEAHEAYDVYREEHREEHWDHWDDRHYRAEYGTVYTEDELTVGNCEASVSADEGITYYRCDGVWYERAFSHGTVTYVVVDRPRRD